MNTQTIKSAEVASSPRKRSAPPGLLSKPNCRATREFAKTASFVNFLKDMSQEFGEVVSLSPVLYMFASSPLIKDALRNTKDFRREDSSMEDFRPLVGQGLFSAQGEIYDQQERVVKSAFGKKYFAEFRKIIDEDVTSFIDNRFSRSKLNKESFNIIDTSVDLTMSIAARAFFGVGGETDLARQFRQGLVFVQDWFAKRQAALYGNPMLHCIEDQYVRLPIFRSLQKSIFRGISGSGAMASAVSSWKVFAETNYEATLKTAASMRGMCAQIIAKRRQGGGLEGKDDVLSTLLRFQKYPENKWLTDELIIDEVATFFVAGHETTSDLFVTLLWKHARGETPRSVVEELQDVGSMINEEQFLFQKYPATNAYLTQVLLDHPPIPFTVRQANRDMEIGGYFIPKDTNVILALCAPRDIDIIFGFARRQCIGRVFALEEAVIGLRHLIRFGLELDDPAQKPEMVQGLTIGYSRSKTPIFAKATPSMASHLAAAGSNRISDQSSGASSR